MSRLNHVTVTHRKDGERFNRRFYWKIESHVQADRCLFAEELSLLLHNLGIEEVNIESLQVQEVLAMLPANSEPVTLSNSLA